MQPMAKPQSNTKRTQVQTVIITAVTLFALAGAIVGFVFGALTHNPQQAAAPQPSPIAQQSLPSTQPTTPVATATPIPTPTVTPVLQVQSFCNVTLPYTTTQSATGATVYNLEIQGYSTVNGACVPLKADGVITHLALVKAGSKPSPISTAINSLASSSNSTTTTFANEIPGGLQFDSTTPQTQITTGGTGSATWKVSLSPSLPKGAYDIVGVVDWKGLFYDWAWQEVYQP